MIGGAKNSLASKEAKVLLASHSRSVENWIVEALFVLCSWERFSHAEFRHVPASPEETAVEEQAPEEGRRDRKWTQGGGF